MAVKLYPERIRCAKCRKSLGTDGVVVDGIYCSYICAGIRAPSRKVDDAPRSCKRLVNGTWGYKHRYTHEGEVPSKLRLDPNTNIYRCDYCHHLHVGHSSPDPIKLEKTNRMVGDIGTFGSVLKRMRIQKKWTVERLAAYLKVPQVRILEIEQGHAKANLSIAFDMLRVVGGKMHIVEK